MEKELKYTAFISYNSKDNRTARWLQKRLEDYSLPSVIAHVYGSNHVKTTGIDANVGSVSLLQGNLQDAYKKFQKHLSSVKSNFGEYEGTHSLFADAHMNMGNYYYAKANEAYLKKNPEISNQYASQAKEEFSKAKSIIETIYGKDYAGISSSLNAIAKTQVFLQQSDSAITNYTKAAELTINQFGKQSPLVAQAYATLGFAYNYKSDQEGAVDEETLNQAKEYYKKAIEIRENSQGNSMEILMTSTMDWRMSLSLIYMKLFDYENSFKIIDKLINELEDLQLENKYPLYVCYFTKANMIIACERDPQDALNLLLKANELFPLLGFSDYLVKEIQYSHLLSSFGIVYEKTGATNDAIKSYEKAYEKLKIFSNNPQVNTMKQNLIEKLEELK
ncbi:MAG: tetratricopeptide repeat protein [Candidatus Cryptobacteroides sp.]